jgi:SpoVK/Ycf46/Vps4 family AAA+-type ATPase
MTQGFINKMKKKMLDSKNSYFRIEPDLYLSELMLDNALRHEIREFLNEHSGQHLLEENNLTPRNRILLVGPKGNGKSSVAEAIAKELNLKMYHVFSPAVIGNCPAETEQTMHYIFCFGLPVNEPCLILFDDVECINDLQARKTFFRSILFRSEFLSPKSIVAVAVDSPYSMSDPNLVDKTCCNDFQARFVFQGPTNELIKDWFERLEMRASRKLGLNLEFLINELSGRSFAEIEEIGMNVLRKLALVDPDINTDVKNLAEHAVCEWLQKARK